MNKFTINKKNGYKIPCISEIPEDSEKIVIVIHGMCSSKESANATYLMDFLPERGIGVIAYDQPGHGDEDAASEELRVGNCIDSLRSVENYIKEEYPDAEICYFGSSFGGYILGLYLARRLNSGNKAFMRCAAVIFPQMILGDLDAEPDPDVMKVLETKGYIEVELGIEKPARFTLGFFEDLKENDLLTLYDEAPPENVKLHFAHGQKDPVVPAGAVKAFAEKHGYPIDIIPDEGHSINDHPESPEYVARLAYDLFCG